MLALFKSSFLGLFILALTTMGIQASTFMVPEGERENDASFYAPEEPDAWKWKVLKTLSQPRVPPPLREMAGSYQAKISSGSIGATGASYTKLTAEDIEYSRSKIIIVKNEDELRQIEETSQLTPVVRTISHRGKSFTDVMEDHDPPR